MTLSRSFPQFGALVRKNFLTKRRSKVQLAVELLVPAIIMLLLGGIKNSLTTEELDAATPTTDTPIVTYEAIQSVGTFPNVLCYDNNMFMRCGCHLSEDEYPIPQSYLSGKDVTNTGATMWATHHDFESLFYYCEVAVTAFAATTDAFGSEDQCVGAKFVRLVCPSVEELGFTTDQVPELDDVCGAGTSAGLDPSAGDYLTMIEDAVILLQDDVGLSIPAAEIGIYCQLQMFAVMPADDGAAATESDNFMAHVTTAFPGTADHWISYASESDFLDVVGDSDYSKSDELPAFAAGVVFTSGSPDWAYTIRSNVTKSGREPGSYFMFNTPETESPTENNCKSPTDCPADDLGRELAPWTAIFHQSPTLVLQQLVDNWIMTLEGSTAATAPVARVTEFPNELYESDGFWSQVGDMFAILVVISVLYPVANVISALVKEKELRIKEGLKMIGLTGAAHTASWVFHFACLFFFTSLLMVLTSRNVFEFSDPVLVFLYFFLFFMASTAFCFFVTAFFSRAKTASTIGTMLFFAAVLPYFALTADGTPASSRRTGCLLPPTCLALGTVSFGEFEDSGEGVTRDTAGQGEDGFTFNDVLGMLILDILIYSALAWYAGNILPSEWGTANQPLFFLAKSYWCPGAMSALSDDILEVLKHDESDGRDCVEPVDDDLRAQVEAGQCVAIRGLRKEYKNSTGGSKVAVDGLDLTMYSGQITALLGHNGAGKTTTIGMLTGMVPVTSGRAFVAGRDVTTDMVNIRNSLGVCPQHDILYPDLTVREHLRMYAVLKAVPSSGLQETIRATLNDVGLTEKENQLTKTLSGGQKRKLSVGIALIGGSKVVFLDEPTSGMDPHSRRFTWDLIRKNREGRVIVLTTHFMDEADLLGDRVAIMADGALRCCGSSLFLKNHYGVGYNVTIVRNIKGEELDTPPDFENGVSPEGKFDEEDYDQTNTTTQEEGVAPIKSLVRSYVEEAVLLSNVGAEVSFQLPNDASPSFQAMLAEIDTRKTELGINSYGVSVTTLEEVFLRVANGTADAASRREIQDIAAQQHRSGSRSSSAVVVDAAINERSTAGNNGDGKAGAPDINRSKPSKPLFWQHLAALLKKRLLTFRRDKKMWAFVVLMPAFFVLAGTLILLAVTRTNEPALLLTPTGYNGGSAPFPYTTECTIAATSATCDPSTLVARMDFPDSAEPVVLGDAIATGDDSADAGVGLMSAALLEESYEDNVYGAVSFREADSTAEAFDYTLHANYSALHSVPLYMNQINTAILRVTTGDDALSIAMTLHPFPRTASQASISSGLDAFNIALFMLIAFSFVPAAWISFIVREKETKCKHQQVVSGVSLKAYWLSSFVWDFLSLFPPVFFTLIVLAAAEVSALISGEAAVSTCLLFLLYGLSMPCYTYLWSFAFSSYSSAQNAFLFHNWIAGLFLPIATTIMSIFGGTLGDVGSGLATVLRVIPPFALGDGLMNMTFMEVFAFLDSKSYTPLSMRITGRSLVYMAVCSVVYSALLIFRERGSSGDSGVYERLLSPWKRMPQEFKDENSNDVDEDVLTEADRVNNGGAESDVVKIKGLRKVYPTRGGVAKVAVKNTSLGIPRGECFGLLGINGAGKSSTLGMLSGELPPSAGSVCLSGFDVRTNQEEVHRLVGYCPQFDALFETLTAREHLTLYASIKGIPVGKRSAAVEQKIEEMGLRQYADRPAGGYSGGNKRKLSVAMAMIGDPQIVFLDEPSTGMDPMARRFMWNVIMRIVTERRECAMILTTHSMEECEALCQRIGIMVGGRLRCLGTSQHLKTRFGKGFQLEARVRTVPPEEIESMLAILGVATNSFVLVEAANGQGTLVNDGEALRAALRAAQASELESEISPTGRGASIHHAMANHGGVPMRDLAAWICVENKCSTVIEFMDKHFPGSEMREKQNAKMRFEFPPQENQTLAQMFGFIENEREALCIGEYALGQTSLEQVFNGFAAQQEEELGHAAGTTMYRANDDRMRATSENGQARSDQG